MGGITDYPPHHTTLPHITKDNWRDECEKKRAKLMASIPNEWRLEGDGKKYEGRDNVMDVPKECGILSEKELQITEMDDAREVGDRAGTCYHGIPNSLTHRPRFLLLSIRPSALSLRVATPRLSSATNGCC